MKPAHVDARAWERLSPPSTNTQHVSRLALAAVGGIGRRKNCRLLLRGPRTRHAVAHHVPVSHTRYGFVCCGKLPCRTGREPSESHRTRTGALLTEKTRCPAACVRRTSTSIVVRMYLSLIIWGFGNLQKRYCLGGVPSPR